eukprot:12796612-Heterocapsa_arctica.AAC.1
MSWGGEGGGWYCQRCSQMNPKKAAQCLTCSAQSQFENLLWAGGYGKGIKVKGDYPSRKGKGDYPYQDQDWKEHKEDTENPARKKLGKMRQALRNVAGIEGWEDRVEEIKAEIKDQLKLSNQEQGISKEEQGQILLKYLSRKTKQMEKFREAMEYYQETGDHNAKSYHSMREEIEETYEELEALGWNQIMTEEESEEEALVSDDPVYLAQQAVAKRKERARESAAETKARHNKNKGRQNTEWLTISDEEMVEADPAILRRARKDAAASAAARRAAKASGRAAGSGQAASGSGQAEAAAAEQGTGILLFSHMVKG